VLSINFAALLVLWYSGYRPKDWFRVPDVRSAVTKRIVVLAVSILLLSVFLGGITYDSYTTSLEEQRVETAVSDVLSEPAYVSLRLDETTVTHTDAIMTSDVDHVVLTVSIPPDESAPSVSGPLQEAIVDALGYHVSVEVQFVEVETAI